MGNFSLDELKFIFLDPSQMNYGEDLSVETEEINIFGSNIENVCFLNSLSKHIDENCFINRLSSDNDIKYGFIEKNYKKYIFSVNMFSPSYFLYDYINKIILSSVICDEKIFEDNIDEIKKNEDSNLQFIDRSDLVDVSKWLWNWKMLDL